MDYKQKYEQALEYMCKVYPTLNGADKEDAEHYFPELKESEDEKIRKEILQSIHDNMCVIHKDKCIAWLEKQGEQKEILCDKCRKEQPSHSCQDITALGRCAVEHEQKTDDKVEPKFKIGDWVVWDNKISCHIDNIYQGKESLMYTITDTNNMLRSYSVKGFDNNAHLWSIQDAKDGDVLVTKDAVFIFKHMDVAGLSLCKSYCDVIGNSGLGFGFDFPIQTVHPATKEQRDKLEKAITAAGYEWNAEKKELKKIEQKSKFYDSMDDLIADALIEEIENSDLDDSSKHNRIFWIKSHRQKPAWSEEDEEVFHCLEYTVKHYYDDKDTINKCCSWLKSLKQRMKGE